ncbi:MAG: hypothetical protein GY754_04430 [bacterium]|nr:hypothetical protein [bacterium]
MSLNVSKKVPLVSLGVENGDALAKSKIRALNSKHYQLIKKLRTPRVEAQITFEKEFKELLDWKYVLLMGKKFVSLVNEDSEE